MNILGMGLLCSRGRGIEAFQQALEDGWREPAAVTIGKHQIRAHLVDLDRIEDKAVLKKLRRADKLSKMAVLAALDAVADSGLGGEERKKIGVIVATAFGAHVTTFEFLDGILDFGESAVSPTVFSNSVHNAAASYISSVLGIQGPTLTVTRFFFPMQSALQLADAWLREGRLEHVLVGCVDQFGEVMGYIAQNRLSLARDGRIDPAAGTAVPGEGAAFFVLSRTPSEKAYALVSDVLFGPGPRDPSRSGLDILDADGLVQDQSAYRLDAKEAAPAAVYSPVYGSMMGGTAFSIAAAALMVRDQKRYPGAAGIGSDSSLVRKVHDYPVDFIRCIRYNCSNQGCSIHIKKTG